MTHFIGNTQVDYHRDTVTITTKNPKAWDNEPSSSSVSIPISDISNLIEALVRVKSEHSDYAAWGGPGY